MAFATSAETACSSRSGSPRGCSAIGQVHLETHLRLARRAREAPAQRVGEHAEVDRHAGDLHRARFELGECEERLRDLADPHRLIADHPERPALLIGIGHRAVEQRLGESAYRGQRRTDLVGHVADERLLRRVHVGDPCGHAVEGACERGGLGVALLGDLRAERALGHRLRCRLEAHEGRGEPASEHPARSVGHERCGDQRDQPDRQNPRLCLPDLPESLDGDQPMPLVDLRRDHQQARAGR